ncbi:HU family DNA-binding protein [uncultured Tateyamaria sp.]|uniref:HU family DNA-binding protein n=1 Tax=uncultured Tateyamaria sp. TaxID=455651 RepID=UPI002639127E|nr:HU family DNA-binding protein [uncultured Tateyamaria sp.]
MATRTTKATTKTTSTRSSATKPKTTTTKSKAVATKPETSVKPSTATTKAATAAPVVVDAPTPVVAGPMMRKKELIDAVVARSGMKKKDVKPAVEATLAVLGEALQDGRALNLHPMGKVKINREKKLASGRMFVARIRQNDTPAATQTDETTTVTKTTDTSDKAAAE